MSAALYRATAPFQTFTTWEYTLSDDAVARFWVAFAAVVLVGGVLLFYILHAGYWTTSLFIITGSWIGNIAWTTSSLPDDAVKTTAAALIVLPWFGATVAQLILTTTLGMWIMLSAWQEYVSSGPHLSEFAAFRLLDVLTREISTTRSPSRFPRGLGKYGWILLVVGGGVSVLAAVLVFAVIDLSESPRRSDQEDAKRLRKRWKANTHRRFRRIRAIEDVARATQLGIPAQFNAGDHETNRLVSESRLVRANEIRALKLLLITPTEATEQEFQRRAVQQLHDIVAGHGSHFAQRSTSARQHQFPSVLRHVLLIGIAILTFFATRQLTADPAGGDLSFPVGSTATALAVIFPYLAVLAMTIIDPSAPTRLSAMRYFGGS